MTMERNGEREKNRTGSGQINNNNNRDMHIQTENEDEQLECYFISWLTFETVCLDDTFSIAAV